MKVVIPTYQRYDCPTLKLLEGIEDVTLFVANEEEEILYREKYPTIKIVVGELGIKNQRNFITNYFEEGEMLVSLDDDILDFKSYGDKPVKTILEDCCLALAESGLGLLTFSPTSNLYFAKKEKDYQGGRYFGIGVAHIYINHKHLQLTVDFVEDFERSALYIRQYGGNLRVWNVCLKHYGWESRGSSKKMLGGIGDSRTHETYTTQRNILLYKYKDIIKAHKKASSKVCSVQISRSLIKENNAFLLPPINPILINELWDILKTKLTSFPRTKPAATEEEKEENRRRAKAGEKKKWIGGGGGRCGFPIYRYGVFGDVFQRVGGVGRQEGANNKKYPELYQKLMEIGKQICPFEFNQIQLAQDLVCPPHIDKKNIGDSMLISVGDYTGGEIVVEGKAYDARAAPVIFNGGKLRHWNNEITGGTKFSFIFFNS